MLNALILSRICDTVISIREILENPSLQYFYFHIKSC